MKRINSKFLITLVFFMFTMSVQAQMKKKQYNLKKDSLEKCIVKKLTQMENLENEKNCQDALIKKISERTFHLANAQEIEKKFLSHFEKLNDLIADSVNVRKFLKWLPKKSDHADAYLKVLDMAASLDTIYDAKKNEGYCAGINGMKGKLYKLHHTGFDALASNVKDYNFVMFELSRVFDIVDKKNYSYPTLHKNGETKFIDNIPYAKKQLQDYIDVSEQRKAIRVKLKEACPEAF